MMGPPGGEEEHEQYSSKNHSLVKHLYLFKMFDDNIGYVV